jgi:hypothetical protein
MQRRLGWIEDEDSELFSAYNRQSIARFAGLWVSLCPSYCPSIISCNTFSKDSLK